MTCNVAQHNYTCHSLHSIALLYSASSGKLGLYSLIARLKFRSATSNSLSSSQTAEYGTFRRDLGCGKPGQLIFRCAKLFSGAEKSLRARLRYALGAGIKVRAVCVNNFCINQNKNIDDFYCNSNEFPNLLFY